MYVLAQTSRNITVRLGNARWNRMLQLEAAYQTALAVARAKRQCEKAKPMSLTEAVAFVDQL